MNKYLLIILLFVICISCEEKASEKEIVTAKNNTPALFENLLPQDTGIDFINQLSETEAFNFLRFEYLQNGAGVAIGDINNDGLSDLYFVGNMHANKMYLNKGDFKFEDITEKAQLTSNAGFKTGVTMVDINNDGYLDIYLCRSALSNAEARKNLLYINNKDLTFTEKSKEYGLDDDNFATQAYFFDMDMDNDLDLYLVNHPPNLRESNNLRVVVDANGKYVLAEPTSFDGVSDRLYRNDGTKFNDISKEAGILNEAAGLSAVIADFNNDQLLDVYVCNDYIKPDYLYINQGNATFKESFDEYFRHSSFSSMGSDIGDINNDGCFDLMTLDMMPRDNYRQKMLGMSQNYDKFQKMLDLGLKAQYAYNTLQLNNCVGNFSDIAFMSEVATTDWSWSSLMADFDNDGFKDLYISNGYYRDVTNNDYARYKMNSLQRELNAKRITLLDWLDSIPQTPIKSYLFRNNGNLQFEDVSSSWNSGTAAFSTGAAYADLNNDGFLDLVVSNINENPFILKNKGASFTKNSYVNIKFSPTLKRTTTGTVAQATLDDGTVLTEYFTPTKGFLSSSDPLIHFGIPEGKKINSVLFIWPNGTFQEIKNPKLNTTLNIEQNSTQQYVNTPVTSSFFKSHPTTTTIKHTENEFIDFKKETLLHHMLSKEGPANSVGDVNEDGLDDLFMGGALGYPASLYLQTTTGDFQLKETAAFTADAFYEDVHSIFFDANGDTHPDLYIVSGGNENPPYSRAYQDRLYINDGKGNFSKDTGALPSITSSGGVVAVHDIDGDKDFDIFVGGRVIPGGYPYAPESFFLINTNGKFTKNTSVWGKELDKIGMITDAVFVDIDKDNVKELVVVGEWMPISVFKWNGKQYTTITRKLGLEKSTGWWYSVTVTDVNKDGYPEIIAGNLGLNSQIKTSLEKPVEMYYKDFDGNSTVDPILTYYNGEKSYPLHLRDRVQDQMIMLKKKFTRYDPYASATIHEIFTEKQLEDAHVLKANTLEHTVFYNKKGNNFEGKTLPVSTQVSVVKSILPTDVDQDGNLDLIVGGNLYATDAQTGRFDASIGQLLLGDGKGSFKVVSAKESGLNIPGNVCELQKIKTAQGTLLWVVRNNDKSSLVKIIPKNK